MPSTRKTIQLSGLTRLNNKLTMHTMLLFKDPLQPFQITTTESMLGLILKIINLTNLNGRPRLLKSLRVDTTSLLKETEFQEALFFLLRLQLLQIITIYRTPGPMNNLRSWTKNLMILRLLNHPDTKKHSEHDFLI